MIYRPRAFITQPAANETRTTAAAACVRVFLSIIARRDGGKKKPGE